MTNHALSNAPAWAPDRHNTLALIGVMLVIIALHLRYLPLWCSMSLLAIIGVRAFGLWRRRPAPHRLLRLLLTLGLAAAVWWQYGTLVGKEAGVTLLLLMTALKLLELRAARDIFVVIFLGLFVQLTLFLNDQSPLAGLAMLLGTAGLFTVLISVQLDDAAMPWRTRIAYMARLAAWALPLMVILFLFFPRASGPLWGMPGDGGEATTGLSDSMSPGSVSKLVQSDALAFRVRFETSLPPSDQMYWRGPVLSRFDGRRWTALDSAMLPALNITINPASAIAYDVTLEAQSRSWLLVLEAPVAEPVLDDGLTSSFSNEMTLTANQPALDSLHYRARSALSYQLQPMLSSAQLSHWLTLPRGFNPRTLALAEQLAQVVPADPLPQNARTPLGQTLEYRLAMTALRYLRTENFRYTLTPPSLGRNSIDEFLFDTKVGFCEHYASAFTILMRAMGVPARVVTGYLGGEINPLGKLVTVRQSEAHAWSEIYVIGHGWVRVDPTSAVSPDRILRGSDESLEATRKKNSWRNWPGLIQLGWYWQIGQAQWQRWVLDWSQARQLNSLLRLGWHAPTLGSLSLLLGGFLSLVIALSAWQILRKRDLRPRAQILYEAACRRLARQGIVPLPHEGPVDFNHRANQGLSQTSASAFDAITHHYIALTYRPCAHPLPLLIQLSRCVFRFHPHRL